MEWLIASYIFGCALVFSLVNFWFQNKDSIKCFFQGHVSRYAGRKSGMVFREDGHGLMGSVRDIHDCSRCGKHLDF